MATHASRGLDGGSAIARLWAPRGGAACGCGPGCADVAWWFDAARRPLEPRTGHTVLAVAFLFDIDQRDLDAAAAFRCRRQRGDVDVIGDPQAEIAVVEAYIGDDGIGGVVGEPAPEPGVEVHRIRFIRAGCDLPGAAKDIFAGARLVVDETADIDGTGRAGDGEEAATV